MTNMIFSPKKILIVGGGHGLGLGLVQACLQKYPESKIIVTYRRKDKASELTTISHPNLQIENLNPIEEAEVKEFCQTIDSLDLFINCVGMLDGEGFGPEKSLKEINVKNLAEVFQVNAFISPLWAKYLKSKFSRETESIFAALSAMVGSIEENQIGGWYGYRASKAALNMFMKNISIEFKRANLKTSVIAIHPGTTETELSKKYLKGVSHKVWKPKDAAFNILNTLEVSREEGTGLFKNWDGRKIRY